jgi:exonuclease III
VDDLGNPISFKNSSRVWGSILVGIAPKFVPLLKESRPLCSGRLLYILLADVHILVVYAVAGASKSCATQILAMDVLQAMTTIINSLPSDAKVMVAGDFNAVAHRRDRASACLHQYDTAAYSIPQALSRLGYVDVHDALHPHRPDPTRLEGELPPGVGHWSFISSKDDEHARMSRIDAMWLSEPAWSVCCRGSESGIAKNVGCYTVDHRLAVFKLVNLFVRY